MATKDTKKRFTVGEMAALCNVSAKQLRYYDANGMLVPEIRNASTGYRYYTTAQIEEVLLIEEMRLLGMSLKEISGLLGRRDLFALKDELEEALARSRAEMEELRLRHERTVDLLLRVSLALPNESASGGIRLGRFPKTYVAYTRKETAWNAGRLFIERRAELYKLVRERGLHMTGPNMAVFHGGYLRQFSSAKEDAAGDLEVCVRVTETDARPDVRAIGPFDAVFATFRGSYQDMKPRYLEMRQWAEKRGLKLSGASLEEYLVGASLPRKKEDYLTRLILPLEGGGV